MRKQRLLTLTAAVGLVAAAPFGAGGQAASAAGGPGDRPAPAKAAAGSVRSGAPAEPPRYRVKVAQWAKPHLNIRAHPGWPGGQPGDVIGAKRPGDEAIGLCMAEGATITAFEGRTGSTWVKIDLGGQRTAWLWDRGLNPHEVMRPCLCGCPKAGTDHGAGGETCDCRAREEGR
ncbi:hypothetical protein GWI34_29190 [Actinomadura sp. DSM 109109]|nr:hypothetical protein [Actinomadura lepetitiana]